MCLLTSILYELSKAPYPCDNVTTPVATIVHLLNNYNGNGYNNNIMLKDTYFKR